MLSLTHAYLGRPPSVLVLNGPSIYISNSPPAPSSCSPPPPPRTILSRPVSCSTSNAVVIADCQFLIAAHTNDASTIVGDTSRRAVLTAGGCSIVQKFSGTEAEEMTAAVMAAHASIIMSVCDAGKGFSGVMEGDAALNDKFCLARPSTVTGC
ncbi:hypothetical protein B0H17DRAFT_1191399 [Mycena rosella]|uniref:Uncharacterized protein n=1 Tax=Mycena rosella TaxID=1033263 RepID=A0AAD7GZQ8_MYCRO|nr:hypothetical protein B0H17DRAFT_1191399 [Mycena rosella]